MQSKSVNILKGTREFLRNYKTEGHLRRDQRWGYEHLREDDAVTGINTHQVPGNDGYVLTPLQLEKEKPLFIEAHFVAIGDKCSSFDDNMATYGPILAPSLVIKDSSRTLIGDQTVSRSVFSLLLI